MIEFTEHEKDYLKINWGDLCTSLSCFARYRFYDPLSKWSCYVLGMNPNDEDEIYVIIDGDIVEECTWTMTELNSVFNSEGEGLILDKQFLPRQAKELFKRLEINKGLRF